MGDRDRGFQAQVSALMSLCNINQMETQVKMKGKKLLHCPHLSSLCLVITVPLQTQQSQS
jgi:hypothetical protein